MAKLSPVFNDQTVDVNGNPASGYNLFTYTAGSSTKQTTYTDEAGLVQQTNPIILNSLGWPTNGPIWLTEGQETKFVLAPPDDTDPPTSPVRTIDNVSGVGDNTVSVSQWVNSSAIPTYVSANSFTLLGDQTSEFQVNRRVQLSTSLGLVYGYISASVFTTLTTVTVVLDSGVLDSGLTAVWLGLLTADNPSSPILKDSNFRISGSADKTKRLAFEVDGLTTATMRTLTAQDKDGTLMLTSDVNVTQNLSLVASVALNALTIAVKTASGADPSPGNPVYVPFRSATLATGSFVMRSITAPLSIVISNGSTLGTTNALASQINVIFIDNAGVVELAVYNYAGALNLPETDFVTTTAEGGAGAADSINTIYSTAARTSVPYRAVGYVVSTQATAGTWATMPSQIQLVTSPFAPSQAWYYLPEQAFTTLTEVDFNNIPPWATDIQIMPVGVSTNGSGDYLVRLGTAASFDTGATYNGAMSSFAGAVATTQNSTGFRVSTSLAAENYSGVISIGLEDATDNTWSITSAISANNNTRQALSSGHKALSATLTRVRFTTAGPDTGDAGVVRARFR